MNLTLLLMTVSLAASPVLAAARDEPLAAPADELRVLADRPLSGHRLVLADFELSAPLNGDSAVVPKPPKPQVPDSRVSARRTGKDGARDAVTMTWRDAWVASLRVEGGPPVDLRPYLAHGTLELDIHVADLAQGGLNFKLSCGDGCERKVNHLLPGRALEGKGWQHLSFALSCFHRDGDDFSRVTQPFAIESSGRGELSIANVRFVRNGRSNAVCADYRTESVTPSPLLQAWAVDWWMPRHEQKLAAIRAMREAGRNPEVVFIGDSITQGWEDAGKAVWAEHFARHDALDLGFGGDHTENVLWRLQHGEIDGIAPKVAVLMIGTNNTGDRQEDPRTTAAGVRRLIDEIRMRQPSTRILLLAIFPRDPRPDGPLRAINHQVNAILRTFADGQVVHFLDIGASLTNPDGTLSPEVMPDWLHLSERGYRLWAEALAPTLARLLSESR
ncbi:GDSL-type esterase/lipase family protein [Mitsuaria sp. GD03876]|uniref:GDSL-type esterase/lipase family protein n=1 Tax=Mitsuaria sp. GD03876 TaxID=2975399 RepID=UPI00244BFFB5|nr:GDSL-type esterase/lipase family protein [Mitsuaria sp. GD03876]MDH0867210.1 GDSL-type esterase/lipase family protein [Mitsuaria sp. GD03876]